MSEKRKWYRTCQECGHKQLDKEPSRDKELTDAYRNRKCKKCHSESLDYGTYPPAADWSEWSEKHEFDIQAD